MLPYCTEDLVLCRRLLDVGCQALMPWAAPDSARAGAPPTRWPCARCASACPDTPLIVDAGLGLPSHAAQVLEWGYDGVLLNTAVAQSAYPVNMARAFAPWPWSRPHRLSGRADARARRGAGRHARWWACRSGTPKAREDRA